MLCKNGNYSEKPGFKILFCFTNFCSISMKILVGSKNPVKIDAVREAFGKYFDKFEVVGLNVESGVSAQPVNSETPEGAKNRAKALKHKNENENLNADFFVGIEGGLVEFYNIWFTLGFICIIDNQGKAGYGTSPLFELPKTINDKLLKGIELGDVIDKLTGENNTKQDGGAIGYFTNGIMDRKELYVPGLITAIIPFLHKDLYFGN